MDAEAGDECGDFDPEFLSSEHPIVQITDPDKTWGYDAKLSGQFVCRDTRKSKFMGSKNSVYLFITNMFM